MPSGIPNTVWKEYDFSPLLNAFKNQTFTEQLKYLAFLDAGTNVTAYPVQRVITEHTSLTEDDETIPCKLDDESLRFVKQMFIDQMSFVHQECMSFY